jgi:hypothetical protein
MKRFWRGMAFVGMLIVSMCSCGQVEEPDSRGTEKAQETAESSQPGTGVRALPEGYVWSARFQDAGREPEMEDPTLVGHTLYNVSFYYDVERKSPVREIYLQEEGEEARQLFSFGKEDRNHLEGIKVGEDGSLYLLYGEDWVDEECSAYKLEKRNQELQVIYSVDTTAGMGDGFFMYDMEVGGDGYLYGLTIDGSVLYWDEEGVYQGQFSLPVRLRESNGGTFGLANAGDSGIYAYWGGIIEGAGNSIQLYDLGKWRELDETEQKDTMPLLADFKSSEVPVVAETYDILMVYGGYRDGLYLADKNHLWQIDLTDGALEPLLGWEDIYLKADYVKDVRRQEDGGFLFYIFDTLEQENYWVNVNAVPSSEIPEKRELVLGVAGEYWYNHSLVSDIEGVVLSYHRMHPECHVTVKEYTEKAVTEFQMELLKGEGPDILLERETFFDMENVLDKGAVEDLAPYLDTAEGISREDILPGILELIAKEGKIPRIPLSFGVDMMILPEELGEEVLTPQELLSYMRQDGEVFIDYIVYPKKLLRQILFGAEMDRYVDEENKSCSFDCEEFVELLEALAALENLEMIKDREERKELFHAGQLPVIVEELDCLWDYLGVRECFSGVGRIAGFPNSSGELRYPARLCDWMGINSASQYKEDAWEFIEFCLSYTSRCDNVVDRFVITKSKFGKQTYFEDERSLFKGTGSPGLWDYSNDVHSWWETAPTTQEDSDFLWEVTEHLYLYENPSLMEVINEEASAFFAGDINAKEAAERIQNRASLVIGE